jgi:ATP-dependent RNA helicase DDX21
MQEDAPSQPCTPPPNPNSVENFELGCGIKELLLDKGITSLFDIQVACHPAALEGKDIVGRARTGCGKTFAFVLPIVTVLMRDKVKPIPGGPNVICLLPTRELAKQVMIHPS